MKEIDMLKISDEFDSGDGINIFVDGRYTDNGKKLYLWLSKEEVIELKNHLDTVLKTSN